MARSHRTLLLGSFLALIMGVALWWFGSQEEQAGAPASGSPAATTAAEAAAAATANELASATPAERTVAPADTAVPPTAAPAGGNRVRGTIVVTDARGAEHASCSGTLRMALLVPLSDDKQVLEHQERDVAVAGGKWEVAASKDAVALQVSRGELDGRPVRCTDEIIFATATQPHVLRARFVEVLLVRVLADDTGVDLGDVRVVQNGEWSVASCTHPGDTNVTQVLAHARSPLQLRPAGNDDTERFWMQSPGYAWGQIVLVTHEPGERVLRLKPGGDVDVTIVGDVPLGAMLRVHATDDTSPIAQLQPTGATTRIDALAEGKWSIALEKGDWFREPFVLGKADVAITRSTIASATITVRSDAAQPPAVDVSGTLRVAAKWGDDLTLELEPAKSLRAWRSESARFRLAQMTKAGDGVYRFGPTSLPCGRYQALVEGTEHRVFVDVGPHATVLDITVPEPCEVRVRVLDATDDKPILGGNLGWYSALADWDGGWSHARSRDAGDGWYEFLAPPGEITVTLHPEGYSWLTSKQTVQPGKNELTLRLPRVCGVEITMKDGNVALPEPDYSFVQLEHAVTKSGAAYWSGNKVAAREPGEHILTVEPIEGFLPVEPRRVQIEPAKWTKVEIVLQRKP